MAWYNEDITNLNEESFDSLDENAWYNHDIMELNESMLDESEPFGADDLDSVGDPADDESIDKSFDDNQDKVNENVENKNDLIDSNYHDDEVDPNTVPQYRTDDQNFKDDPTKFDGGIMKPEEGTDTVEMESFDWDKDIFDI